MVSPIISIPKHFITNYKRSPPKKILFSTDSKSKFLNFRALQFSLIMLILTSGKPRSKFASMIKITFTSELKISTSCNMIF